MRLYTSKRHIIDSFKSLKRNGWMSVASVSAVSVTLLLLGIFLALVLNVNKLSTEIENDVHVRVLIDRDTTTTQKEHLRTKLESMTNVAKVQYSSRNNELKRVVGHYGSSFRMFSGDENPLNDVFIVSTQTPQATVRVARQANNLKYVDSASYGGRQANQLFKVMGSIRTWATAFTLLLLFVAIFLISNTIRITILSRQDEIGIMRLVGATKAYIRWPFLLEGAWTGLLGAILPIILIDLAYHWVYGVTRTSLTGFGYSLAAPTSFLWSINLLMVLVGVLIGSVGSIVSMRRFLKV
ncbi:ABC transporter permease [Lactobacillus sp. CC-MHH1034]|uniref:permease-like cell division protein FtsX n=1 Tax=Agrilactobacillus fermenti TaxID=2586909 RepID=UPI001E5A389A|nr:permease-like cell division protein FtsX [Agrilactobacillus fermenti]MCD2257215.1 ABC transporter permease [Agrilactobacillus fermenti]